jgi:hypothetical protein
MLTSSGTFAKLCSAKFNISPNQNSPELTVGGGAAGQIILGRQRHVKRMKEEQLDIETWNVNTMLKAGKMQEITDQIVGSQIQIIAHKKSDGRDMVY